MCLVLVVGSYLVRGFSICPYHTFGRGVALATCVHISVRYSYTISQYSGFIYLQTFFYAYRILHCYRISETSNIISELDTMKWIKALREYVTRRYSI